LLQNWFNPQPNLPSKSIHHQKAWSLESHPGKNHPLQRSLSTRRRSAIGINPISPDLPKLVDDFKWDPLSGDHPLSARALLRVILDPSTKEKAPLKSTLNNLKFPLAYELMVAE
jgi:hypothetical protein